MSNKNDGVESNDENEVDNEDENEDQYEDDDDESDGDEPELSEHGKEIYGLEVEIKHLRGKLEATFADNQRMKDLLAKSRSHVKLLLKEMDCRATDLENLHNLYKNNSSPSDWKENFMAVLARHNEHDKLFEEAMFDTRLLPAANKAWQDQLWQVGGVLHSNQGGGGGGNGSSSDNDGKQSDKDSGFAMGHLVDELNGRVKDLQLLFSLYDPNNEKNRAYSQADSNETRDQFGQIMSLIDKRQNEINKSLEANDVSIKKDVKENNNEWKKLIQQSGQSRQAAEELVHELQARTIEFTRVLNVLKGDEFPNVLTQIAESCEERHKTALSATQPLPYLQKQQGSNKSKNNNNNNNTSNLKVDKKDKKGITDSRVIRNNSEWLESLTSLANDPLSLNKGGGVGGNNNNLVGSEHFESRMNIYIKEMEERSNDIKELKSLFLKFKSMNIDGVSNIGISLEELKTDCNNFLFSIKERHNECEKEMKSMLLDSENYDNIVNFETEKENKQIITNMNDNNRDWRSEVGKFLAQISTLGTNSKNASFVRRTSTGSVFFGVSTPKVGAQSGNLGISENENDGITIKSPSIGAQGAQALGAIADTESKSENASPYDEDANDDAGNTATTADFQIDPALLNNDPNTWWLDKNIKRSEFIDSIIVDATEHEHLMEIGIYLNRLFGNQESDTNDVHSDILNLYIPIEFLDNHHVLSVLYDGVVLCNLFNAVDPNFVDKRCVHVPTNVKNPLPLEDDKITDNINLVLASAKALGLRLPRYDVESWKHSKHHIPILLSLVKDLARAHLKSMINFEKHPELARLLKQKEDADKVRLFTADEWIKRWLNFVLNKPVLGAIGDYNVDIWDVLSTMEGKKFTSDAPASAFNDNPQECGDYLLKYVKNNLNVKTTIEASDLINEYSKCQELLIAQIFDKKNNLSLLNKQEIRKYSVYWVDDNPDDDQFIPWINGMLPPHLQVANLYKDLSTGVVLLKILEKMKPGCVDWKKMRQNVRHKFDKVHNCNKVIKLCEKEFPFKIVGIGGTDLVDGHKKYIETLLWQVMRYQSTRTISELNFGGKNVTDKDILKWSQDRHKILTDSKQNETETIKSFKDPSLTSCVYYVELLKIITNDNNKNENDKTVIDKYVHYKVSQNIGKKDLKNDTDGSLNDRMENARYIISLLRRFGSEIFVAPDDLVFLESKAVLSTLAALMTLDYRLNKPN